MGMKLVGGLVTLTVLWVPTDAAGQTVESVHCLASCPSGAPMTNTLLVREIYALSNNPDTKFADWVAYRVTAETIGPSRSRNWRADPWLLPEATLEPRGPDDYRRANAVLGTDRGHQVPLASFSGTAFWRDTNVLSNITPQRSDLNQGPWQRVEAAERVLALDPAGGPVFVVTGPLYERTMAALPEADEPHQVPSGYWKVLAVEADAGLEVAAFIFEQETMRGADICDHLTTVTAVQARSGLDLFSSLEDAIETALESQPAGLSDDLGCP